MIVFVSGAVASKPWRGGEAWIRLSWIQGLRRLGVRVVFVEHLRSADCFDDHGEPSTFKDSINLQFFQQTMAQFGFSGDASLLCDNGAEFFGVAYGELLDIAEQADLFINISGHLELPELIERVRKRAYVDEDPGYTQFWHAAGLLGGRLSGYDIYYTLGGNFGRPECTIPTGGIVWHPLSPPVVLDQWPTREPTSFDRFTTVASWRGGYGRVEYAGKSFGLKAHEFRKFITLPRLVPQSLEIALSIDPADARDLEALKEHGWRIVDPRAVAADPIAFQQYVQTSGAEFSVAQGIYVETASGWFSDRTVRYLASGKPVLVQDTGIGRRYPVGEGLLTFSNLEQAVAGAEAIRRDYAQHCRAARAIAEEYFDSDRVIGRVLEDVGL